MNKLEELYFDTDYYLRLCKKYNEKSEIEKYGASLYNEHYKKLEKRQQEELAKEKESTDTTNAENVSR